MRLIRLATWTAAALFFWLPLGCRQPVVPAPGGPTVRVCLLQNLDRLQLTSTTQVVARSSAEGSARRLNFPPNAPVSVALAPEGWHIGNVVLGGGELKLTPASEGSLRVDGKAYRGEYRLVPVAPNRFDVVNDVNIESYLRGVIPGEMPSRWHIEAYKAQAITARTYVLWEMNMRPPNRPYDVFDDEKSQVYNGIEVENSKSQTACAETSGVVLGYGPPGQEKIFKAYFSSCCGGVTQSVTDGFNEEPTPPLSEQSVGGLCNASPKYNWPPIVLSKTELTRRIRAWGAKRGRAEKDMPMLARIDVAAQNQFGRPVRFTLTDTRGTRYSLSGEETRWACNADANGGPTLYSSFFRPVSEPEAIRFVDGHGYGHGVGLCQWCTEARAEQGMKHEDILIRAFPRSRLVRAY